jgi:hypothetical protein
VCQIDDLYYSFVHLQIFGKGEFSNPGRSVKDLELLLKFSIRPHISYVGAQFFCPGVDSDPSMASIVSSSLTSVESLMWGTGTSHSFLQFFFEVLSLS